MDANDPRAFNELSERYRRELQLHCYRMLGSVQDAEDLVQETLLAAWRGLDRFEGRSSLRTWLHRIATNRCLNELRDAGRRPRELVPRELPPDRPPPSAEREPVWLQPYPEPLLDAVPDGAPGPDARYEVKESLGLAFVTGLQRLPPLQRAVLVLRDVHGFRANEVAEMLETTVASANSALHRARAALAEELAPHARDHAPLPHSPAERELVGRFAEAFESADIDALVELLTDDARFSMPPETFEYTGREAVGRFLSTVPAGGRLDRFRLVPTRANGQPAFAIYVRDAHTPLAHASGIMVLTLAGERVAAMTVFHDTSVFPQFGLPRTLR
ncbi:MAG TPA: sigma-70 family RNA polymerase sigma factor [Thermoleophilaceae bacterium]|jgi:RNA polymerase sigma-70 factor (ECF subfamily)